MGSCPLNWDNFQNPVRVNSLVLFHLSAGPSPRFYARHNSHQSARASPPPFPPPPISHGIFDLPYNKIMRLRRKGNMLEEAHILNLSSVFASVDHMFETQREYIGRGPHSLSVVWFGFRRARSCARDAKGIYWKRFTLYFLLSYLTFCTTRPCTRDAGGIYWKRSTLYFLSSYLASVHQDHVLETQKKYIGRVPRFFLSSYHVLEIQREYFWRGPHFFTVVLSCARDTEGIYWKRPTHNFFSVVLFDLLYYKIVCSRLRGNLLKESHAFFLSSYHVL